MYDPRVLIENCVQKGHRKIQIFEKLIILEKKGIEIF